MHTGIWAEAAMDSRRIIPGIRSKCLQCTDKACKLSILQRGLKSSTYRFLRSATPVRNLQTLTISRMPPKTLKGSLFSTKRTVFRQFSQSCTSFLIFKLWKFSKSLRAISISTWQDKLLKSINRETSSLKFRETAMCPQETLGLRVHMRTTCPTSKGH